MKRPGLFRGVIVAAVMAVSGAIAFAGLAAVFSAPLALRLVTVALGGAYVLYLLGCATDRTGRIAVFAGWAVTTAGFWLLLPEVAITLITQALLISLVRALYHHASVLAGLMDLGLSVFALAAAVWASGQSGSVFLTIWSFFLVQALFVGIPPAFRKTGRQRYERTATDEFNRALRAAETAIRRIATERS